MSWPMVAGLGALVTSTAYLSYRWFTRKRSYLVQWTADGKATDDHRDVHDSGASVYVDRFDNHDELISRLLADIRARPAFVGCSPADITFAIERIHVLD